MFKHIWQKIGLYQFYDWINTLREPWRSIFGTGVFLLIILLILIFTLDLKNIYHISVLGGFSIIVAILGFSSFDYREERERTRKDCLE